ncbi:hypothetical protein ACLGI4_20695 [Streptomyces sp. HMX112]|uniref:hypothetical protein n=1 Tax=Streptomyces sp. HMX112 TaxID=3390850 RepID=UPI003A802812
MVRRNTGQQDPELGVELLSLSAGQHEVGCALRAVNRPEFHRDADLAGGGIAGRWLAGAR